MFWLRIKVKVIRAIYPRIIVEQPRLVFSEQCKRDIKRKAKTLRRSMRKAMDI